MEQYIQEELCIHDGHDGYDESSHNLICNGRIYEPSNLYISIDGSEIKKEEEEETCRVCK